jgi:hypothetical protein
MLSKIYNLLLALQDKIGLVWKTWLSNKNMAELKTLGLVRKTCLSTKDLA